MPAIQAHATARRRPATREAQGRGYTGAWPKTPKQPTTTRKWQQTHAFPRTPSPRTRATRHDSISSLSKAIQEHLDLKQRNAGLDTTMPLDRYSLEDPFENHPLFKSEEQARLEETLDGVEAPTAESQPARGRARSEAPEGARARRGPLGSLARLRLGRVDARQARGRS